MDEFLRLAKSEIKKNNKKMKTPRKSLARLVGNTTALLGNFHRENFHTFSTL